jgi:hypothetical protein
MMTVARADMDPKTFTEFLTPVVGLGTAIAGLGGAVIGITKYFNYRSERDKIRLIGDAFEAVITSLRSDNPVERMAAAIRLRRFYDQTREMGTGKEAPYAKVAVDVTVAILRSQPTGDFQKLLADGLGLAPTLRRADLQRTNLQFAYLGARRQEDGVELEVDLSHADFYRADLSRASLKKANAQYDVFYQSRLQKTVFKGANLVGANFFDADLSGAIFDGAMLNGANFSCARELPFGIQQNLDDKGVYCGEGPFRQSATVDKGAECTVFVSKPGCLGPIQKLHLDSVLSKLRQNGLVPKMLERSDYPQFGAVGEVRRILQGCKGALIFGFAELTVSVGTWRTGTPEATELKNFVLPTAWVQIEAGMAAMAGLLVLVLHENDLDVGIFGVAENDTGFYRAKIADDWDSSNLDRAFSNWVADVREVSRSEPS